MGTKFFNELAQELNNNDLTNESAIAMINEEISEDDLAGHNDLSDGNEADIEADGAAGEADHDEEASEKDIVSAVVVAEDVVENEESAEESVSESMDEVEEAEEVGEVEEATEAEDEADEVAEVEAVEAAEAVEAVETYGKIEMYDCRISAGVVTGNVCCQNELRIEETAKFIGDIKADSAFIDGEVFGDIKVLGMLSVGATAKIIGNVTFGTIEIKVGAIIKGNLNTAVDTSA